MAFEYTPYRNPYIGTIADLMARGEDAKAKALIDVASAQSRAAEAKGQIYGNAISSIGNQIGNIPEQMQANKEQAFKADQQARMVRGQQQEDAAKAMFNQIMGAKNVLGVTSGPLSAPVVTPATTTAGTDMESENIPDTPETQTLPSRAFMPTVTNPFKELSVRGVDGLDKWDVEKASQQFASLGLGVEGQKYLELMRGSNDDMDKHHASAMDLVRKSATRALQAGSFDMMLGSTNALMSQLANNKVIGREDLAVFQQQLDGVNALPQGQKESALRGLLRNISGVPEEEYTLPQGGVRYRGATPISANPLPPPKPAADTASIQEYKLAVKQGYKGSLDQWLHRPNASNQTNKWEDGQDSNGNLVFYRTTPNGDMETRSAPPGLATTSAPKITQTISAQGKAVLRSTDAAEPLMDRLMVDMKKALPGIDDPKLNAQYNTVGAKIGALADWAKYNAGFESGNTPQIQISKLLQAVQAGQYMTSSRNIRMLDLVLSHLSDPKQTPLRQYQSLVELKSLMPDIRAAVLKSEEPVYITPQTTQSEDEKRAAARNAILNKGKGNGKG